MSEELITTPKLSKLRRLAQRLARTGEEADDLVQHALLAALERNRPWDEDRFLPWTSGVMMRRALFIARTAGRRRRRDSTYVEVTSAPSPPCAKLPLAFIEALPRSLQTIARLANAGLGREEIAHVLDISDVALRKRVSDLRKAWSQSGADADFAAATSSLPCGIRRRSLKSALLRLPEARCAITDPDGHEIFLGPTHKMAPRGNYVPG